MRSKHSKKRECDSYSCTVSKGRLCCAAGFYVCPNQYSQYNFIPFVHSVTFDLTALVILPCIGVIFHHKRRNGGHISQVQIVFFKVGSSSSVLGSKMFCEKDYWILKTTPDFPFLLWHSYLNCSGDVSSHKGGLVGR